MSQSAFSDFDAVANSIVEASHRLGVAGLAAKAIQIPSDDGCTIGASDAAVREDAARVIQETLGVAGQIGADLVTIDAGAVLSGDRKSVVNRYEDVYHYSLEVMTDLRFEAAARCIRVACRLGSRGFLVSPMDARRWLDDVNSPWVGGRIDPTFICANGCPLDWCTSLGHRLMVVDFSAPSMSAGGVAPIDWPPLISGIGTINNDAVVVVDANPPAIDAAARVKTFCVGA